MVLPEGPSPYLGAEVVLLQLPPLPQVPAAHGVVQAPCPQLGAIVRDVNAAGTVCVALKLPGKEGDGEGEGTAVRAAGSPKSQHPPVPALWPLPRAHLTIVWFCRSHTTMLPSLQHEKQTLASGLMARA